MQQVRSIDIFREIRRGITKPLVFTELVPQETGWTRWFLMMVYTRCAAGMFAYLFFYLVTVSLMISGFMQTSIGQTLTPTAGFFEGATFSQVLLSVIYIIGIFPIFVRSEKRAETLQKFVLIAERKILLISFIGGVCGWIFFLRVYW